MRYNFFVTDSIQVKFTAGNEWYRPTRGVGGKSANRFVFMMVPGYYGGMLLINTLIK